MEVCLALLFLESISFFISHIEGELVVLAPHGQVSNFLPIGFFIVDCVHIFVSKLNDGVVVTLGYAVVGERNTGGD
jgi:hypothetical protein